MSVANLPKAPVRVLDQSLTLLSEIDVYSTLYFTRGFNAPGDWEITINWNIVDGGGYRYADYFQRGRFILVGGDVKKIGIILQVTKDIGPDGKGSQVVTVTGQEATALTNRRYVYPPTGYANYTQSAAAETVMKTVVAAQLGSGAAASRQMSIINIAASAGLGATYNYAARYTNLTEDLTKISVATAIGWRLAYNPSSGKLDFDCYAGVNRVASQSTNPRMIISTDFDTLATAKLTDSEVVYKNLIIAAGQGVGEDRNIRLVYDTTEPTGIERREYFADMRDLSANADIDTRGASLLKENLFTKFVDASSLVYTQYKIGVDYDLGDYITVAAYGESSDVQITAIKETWGAGDYQLEFTFNRSYPELPSQIKSSSNSVAQALANTEGYIVDSGSNANGSYIKFSDGTLIQYGYITITMAIGVAGYPIYFPISFVTAPALDHPLLFTITPTFHWTFVPGGRDNIASQTYSNCIITNNGTSQTAYVSWAAIGKWK